MPPGPRAFPAVRPGRRAPRPRRHGEPGGYGVAPAPPEEVGARPGLRALARLLPQQHLQAGFSSLARTELLILYHRHFLSSLPRLNKWHYSSPGGTTFVSYLDFCSSSPADAVCSAILPTTPPQPIEHEETLSRSPLSIPAHQLLATTSQLSISTDLLFWTCHVDGIIQRVFFYVWLLSVRSQ
uniref:SREBP regulating gene protein isoform X4 n=1 Tax=Panthera onca TaxID=9690 RepID=UPI002952D4C2|nr:SREBP regulating gene protein isoform X4 [Panthera onca]